MSTNSNIKALQARIKKLETEIEENREFSAQLYQIVGDISFEHPKNETLVKVLDNLSDVQAGNVPRHKELLPFSLNDES